METAVGFRAIETVPTALLLIAGAFAASATPEHPDSNPTAMKTTATRTKDRTKGMCIQQIVISSGARVHTKGSCPSFASTVSLVRNLSSCYKRQALGNHDPDSEIGLFHAKLGQVRRHER
jgi:hypothetical protein